MSATGPRVLVVRYSALGDVVLATSILDPLLAALPGARIEWVTSPRYAPLLAGLPQLAAVHALEREGPRSARALRARFRGQFDIAIDLQHKVRSAVVAAAAAPRRIVFRRRTPGRALLALLGSDPPLARAHATALYAEALAPLGVKGPGALHLGLAPGAHALGEAALAGLRRPVVAIAPGARWKTKRWPIERFAHLAEQLAEEGASVVLAGGPDDRDVLVPLRAALRVPIAADLSPMPLDGLAAALARVDLLVACDSGPAHLAAAAGVPALVLFGPTSRVRWGPPPPGRALSLDLPCAPCSNHGDDVCPLRHHRCLQALSEETVLRAARELLAVRVAAPVMG